MSMRRPNEFSAESHIIAWVLARPSGVQCCNLQRNAKGTVSYSIAIYLLRGFGRYIRGHNHRTLTSVLELVRDIRSREYPVKRLQREGPSAKKME